MAADSKNIQNENRETVVKTISKHIEDAIELQRDFGGNKKGFLAYLTQCGKTKGVYVSWLYLLIKFMYIANVVGQFFLLNAFLGPRYKFWGAEILGDLARGQEWTESGHFPRVTMCDFEVRVLGNLHRYTIQCVLMINMFNEKIFLFLWWWFLLVAVATILNTFYWVFMAVSHAKRFAFIARYLRVTESAGPMDRRSVNKFVTYCLRPDGVFMLRMISSHAGELAATEIAHMLWKNFRERIYKPPALIADFKGPVPDETYPLINVDSDRRKDALLGEDQGFMERFYQKDSSKIQPPLPNRPPNNHNNNGAGGNGRSRAPSYEKATTEQLTAYQSSV